MKRLIYMDDTMDKLRAYAERKHNAGHTELANGILKAVNYIRNNIVRVDAVEVVRCKDCKWYQIRKWDDEKPEYDCRKTHALLDVSPDDFCSYGERRADA